MHGEDPSPAGARAPLLCVGIVTGARGVRGEVWVKSFTQNLGDIAKYGALTNEIGEAPLTLTVRDVIKGKVLARIAGIKDRSEAEGLKGRRLYLPRSALPTTEEDEYYHADLEGMAVFVNSDDNSPRAMGTIRAVHDFGAGAILEVNSAEYGTWMVPFTRAAVPDVDVTRRRLFITPLPGLLPDDPSGEEPGA